MRPKKYISIIFFSVILLGAICFVIFFKIYFVKGDSMSPTLKEGHAVLLLRNVDYDDLQVGDLIVFHSDEYGDCIKRIAAVSGDSIKQKNSELYINNVLKYQYATDKKAEYLVGDDELYVLGDNFYNSIDSREIGPIAYSAVVGKIVFS